MKKVQKTLTGALATVMAAGMVPVTAMAATNFDALHKAAYDAVKVAQETKTQKDINAARALVAEYKAAIIAEGKDGLLVNINTFSELLDVVQGPVLSEIVKAVLAMQEAGTATQAEINAVRTLMEGDQADDSDNLPASLTEAVKTWSSAVDVFQKELLDAAVAAVKTAETEKTTSAIEAAKVLVDDLSTAVREGIKNVATTLQERLDAIVVGLEVTNVVNITTSKIEVEFKALEEALRDVSIEVIDNKGNIVEVDTNRLLIEGETEATFYFKSVLKEEPTGVWTVNGVKVDLSERAFVAKAKSTTGKELGKLLKDSKYVTGYVENNLEAYQTAIAEKEAKINTAADVQKIIDEVNKNAASEKQVEYVIKVAESGTSTQFKNALAELELDRVNPEWMSKYKTAVAAVTENKVIEVQEAIDTVNEERVQDAIDAIAKTEEGKFEEKAAKIEDALALVEDFIKEDEKDETTKADLVKSLNVQSAILRVNTAETVASLKSALVNLSKVVNDKNEFDYDAIVNESLMKDYLLGKVNAKDTVKEIADAIKVVEGQVVDTAIAIITEKANVINTAKDEEKVNGKQALLDAFNRLQTVSAKATVKFDASKVNADLYDLYASEFATVKADVKAVQDGVTKVNGSIVSSLLKNVTAEELLKTLQDGRLGLTNVVTANDKAYQEELEKFNALTDSKELVKLVNRVNYKQEVLAAKSVSEVKTALVKYVVESDTTLVINLKDVQRTDVAEELVAALKDKEVKTLDDLDGYIITANNNRVAMITAVNNTEGDIEATKNVLETISSEYKALDVTTKLLVAEKFDTNRPKDSKGNVVDFTNYTEIRALIASSL